jgi:hypothetical protein
MKTISTFFTTVLCLLGSVAFAQFDSTQVLAGDTILIYGDFTGAPLETSVQFSYQGGGMVNTFSVTCDPEGSFSTTFVLPSDYGNLNAIFTTCDGLEIVQTQAWGGFTQALYFYTDYCNGPVGDCNTEFYFAPTDSNFVFTGDVYIYLPAIDPGTVCTWDFGTGDSSNVTFPVYDYASFGTYTLCLTILAADGCTSTFCDTFTVAEDGTVSGFGANSQGFTLKVVAEGTQLAVAEENITTAIAQVFPNPVNETASLRVNSARANKGTLEIVNLQGQIMQRTNWSVGTGSTAIELPVETLRSGMYMVRLIDANGAVSTTSFVK